MTTASASLARRGTASKKGVVRKSITKTVAVSSLSRSRGGGRIPGLLRIHTSDDDAIQAFESLQAMSVIERHDLVMSGLDTRFVREVLSNYSAIPESDLLHAIGVSSRTLDRREDSKLGQLHSGAALALIEVTDMAQRVLGTRKLAEQWLKEPALALDGKLPLDLIASAPGIEAVKDLLTRMEYGVYA